MTPFIARLQLADEVRQRYRMTVDAGCPVTDALDRKAWVHVAKQLREGDVVELLAEDRVWYAEVLVTALVITEMGVHIPSFALIHSVDLTKAERRADSDAYTVKFNGPADKFIIIRNSDKEKIEKGLPSKEAAETKLAELLAA